MSLLDFIFPDQAQAVHLGDIADAAKSMRLSAAAKEADENSNVYRIKGLSRRVEKLENDLQLLSLINALLIKKYIQDTGKSLQDLQAEIKQVDASDGVVDGGLDTHELRRIVGIQAPAPTNADDTSHCPDCGRVMSKALGRCLYCGGKPA